MKALTDKAILFRTYPISPKKRVKFDPGETVEFSEFGSGIPAFKCRGGYLTHHSYNLLDYFVSHWFEIARRDWTAKFGAQYPNSFDNDSLAKLTALSPILNMAGNGSLNLEHDLLGLCHNLADYVVIDLLSDRVMRSHPSLKGISSEALNEIIEKTSRARLKLNYHVRSIKTQKKRQFLGYIPWYNLGDDQPWSKIFDYRVEEEIKGADGRILERIYKFGFKNPLGVAMIHNTICGGSWSVNPAFYDLSADAQLLYRYLVITGSRRKNNTAEFLAHRLAWREKQKSRIIQRLKALFEEMLKAGLIQSFDAIESRQHGSLFSHQIPRRRSKREKA